MDTFAAVKELIAEINENLVNPFIILLIAAAFLWFLWGVALYIIHSDSEEERAIGRRHMIWGIVGIFIMVAVFGILKIVLNSFGVPIPEGI